MINKKPSSFLVLHDDRFIVPEAYVAGPKAIVVVEAAPQGMVCPILKAHMPELAVTSKTTRLPKFGKPLSCVRSVLKAENRSVPESLDAISQVRPCGTRGP